MTSLFLRIRFTSVGQARSFYALRRWGLEARRAAQVVKALCLVVCKR